MKHIYSLSLTFLLIANNILAQEIKTATYRNGNVFKSFQYYLLNEFNDTIYNGNYLDSVYHESELLSKKGFYQNGVETGKWIYIKQEKQKTNGELYNGGYQPRGRGYLRYKESYSIVSAQYNDKGQLDGLFTIETKRYNSGEPTSFWWGVDELEFSSSGNPFIGADSVVTTTRITYRNGIQQDFYSKATLYIPEVWRREPLKDWFLDVLPVYYSNKKLPPMVVVKLSGKFDENGVATGEWELLREETKKEILVPQNSDSSEFKNNFFEYKNFLINKNYSMVGTYIKIRNEPSEYNSLEKKIESFIPIYYDGPKFESISYSFKLQDESEKFYDIYISEGREAKATQLINELSPIIIEPQGTYMGHRFNEKLTYGSEKYPATITLFEDLKKAVDNRSKWIEKKDNYYFLRSFLSNFEKNYLQDIELLSKYLQVKKDEIKIDTIAQKYNCQNYIDYNTFKSKCNQRWNIIESQTSGNGYSVELEKLHPFVKNTLNKCKKIEFLANADSVTMSSNMVKEKIISKYSLAYKELFSNLCNESDESKQAQLEQDIELLQKKTQEICSMPDTKAFEKQLKSTSDAEQIKTMIINYK